MLRVIEYFAMTLLSRACVSLYEYSIETVSVSRTVYEIFSVKEYTVTLKPGKGLFKVIENGAVQ